MKVISDYDYNTNVIDYDYDYIAFESHDCDYDYLRSCNRLQSITITDYEHRTLLFVYDVGVVLYPNDIQCLQTNAMRDIAIHHLLISVAKIYLMPITLQICMFE